MRERDLARTCPPAATADERGGGSGVVRRSERTPTHEMATERDARSRVDAGDLQRLRVRQRREDRAEPSRQHRLARAGRSAEQEMVSACSCDLERLASERQTAHVGEVDHLVVEHAGGGVVGRRDRWIPVGPGFLALQARPQLTQGARRPHPYVADQFGLGGVGERHDHRRRAGACQRIDQCEGARHRAHRAVEAQLAEHRDTVEHTRGQCFVGAEHAEGHRELQPRAGLAHPARSEVDRDAVLRPRQARRQALRRARARVTRARRRRADRRPGTRADRTRRGPRR